MNRADFRLGLEFILGNRTYRVTDLGRRTVVAIRVDVVDAVQVRPGRQIRQRTLDRETATREGWFNDPPYAVVERVFDENDLPACVPTET